MVVPFAMAAGVPGAEASVFPDLLQVRPQSISVRGINRAKNVSCIAACHATPFFTSHAFVAVDHPPAVKR